MSIESTLANLTPEQVAQREAYLERLRDNTYFDQTGTQILVNDLLKVYHYGSGNRTQYMYHVAVMEEHDFPVMAVRCYTANEPHCRLISLANKTRILMDYKIIYRHDWQSKRKKIKIEKEAQNG